MHRRLSLLLAVSALSLSAGVANAADADTSASNVGELVVTGSRAAPRSRLDTVSPVDSISAQSLTHQANSAELAQALSNLTPSLDFPRPAITDGTDHLRPATLRGLAPDQTLVLIDGIRGHVSALVNVNGSIGRGSTAFDLNSIPTIALESVEILRDGASAQYGSDAIAGVINLRLRQARSGGGAVFNYGGYHTSFDTSRGHHSGVDDGKMWSASGWQGLPLGEEGYLTLSAEVSHRDPTNRSDFVNVASLPLYTPTTVLGRFGDPELKGYAFYGNVGFPLSEVWSFHGYAGYQHRNSIAAATARAYNNANNVPAVYPLGFLPKIEAIVDDFNLAGGFTGEWEGYKIDLTSSYGRNEIDYRVLNSINGSFGVASKTEFRAGKLGYEQFVTNLNVSKEYDVGLAEPLTGAAGVEYRHEQFRISPGEPASYSVGPDTTKAGVSQGFPGFRPSNSINNGRHNWSAYVDLEGKATEALSFGLAGRYENYSDFGSKVTGKASARYDFNDVFALRGAIQTGFRAPALQQQFFTYTSTNNVILNNQPALIEVGTFPVNSAVAIALGAKPLQPETSVNYSAGAVLRTGGFELTVDAYRIDMKNRIVLSENLPNNSTPAGTAAAITAILAPFGVSAARFFINGVNTTTTGVDIVARYRLDTDGAGRFDLTGAANFNHTDVTKTPDIPSLTNIPSPPFLFDRGNVLSFEEGTPERKLVGSVDWTLDRVGATLRVTNYDSVLVPNNTASFDYETGDATLVDLEGRFKITERVEVAVGANNLFDEYPNFTPGVLNTTTGSVGFPSYSPFGFNGRFIYGRVNVNW